MDFDKKILDACCGSRMFWFNKKHPDVLYCDIRSEILKLCDGRTIGIQPDAIIDYRKMPFPDNTFLHVVFDPPHRTDLGGGSWMAKKYGRLLPTWETDIKAGFDECIRVLKPGCTMVFKWNEDKIPIKKLLSVLGAMPLYGHPTRHGKTIWMVFIKM
jgi:ubiquinone/menaquinone biosynthesis C-methylase UbiE